MALLRNLARGSKLKKAFDNLVAYYNKYDERDDGVGKGKAKPAQTVVYVHPFAFDFDADYGLQSTANSARWTSHQGKFASRTKTVAPVNTFKFRNFRPARVRIQEGVNPSGARKVSKRTKLPYLNYGGISGSIPFGRSNATDEQLTAFQDIKEDFGTPLPASLRLSLTQEYV